MGEPSWRRWLVGLRLGMTGLRERAWERMRPPPESRTRASLRALEDEALGQLERAEPREAVETFRRQEALARRHLPQTLEPVRARILQARALAQAGEAFSSLEAAARRDADSHRPGARRELISVLHQAGFDCIRRGRPLSARTLLEAALALRVGWEEDVPPTPDGLRMMLVPVLRQLGDLAAVEHHLRAALAEVGRRGESGIALREDLAHHCKTQGRWEEALVLYRAALEEALAGTEEDEIQSVPVERMRVAEVLHHLSHSEEAFAELDKAEAEIITLDGPEGPGVPTVLRLRGKLLRAQGREDEARALFARADALAADVTRRER